MSPFLSMLDEAKREVRRSHGADVTVARELDAGKLVLSAFSAGGNVKPGAFRQSWFLNGAKISKDEAKQIA